MLEINDAYSWCRNRPPGTENAGKENLGTHEILKKLPIALDTELKKYQTVAMDTKSEQGQIASNAVPIASRAGCSNHYPGAEGDMLWKGQQTQFKSTDIM